MDNRPFFRSSPDSAQHSDCFVGSAAKPFEPPPPVAQAGGIASQCFCHIQIDIADCEQRFRFWTTHPIAAGDDQLGLQSVEPTPRFFQQFFVTGGGSGNPGGGLDFLGAHTQSEPDGARAGWGRKSAERNPVARIVFGVNPAGVGEQNSLGAVPCTCPDGAGAPGDDAARGGGQLAFPQNTAPFLRLKPPIEGRRSIPRQWREKPGDNEREKKPPLPDAKCISAGEASKGAINQVLVGLVDLDRAFVRNLFARGNIHGLLFRSILAVLQQNAAG